MPLELSDGARVDTGLMKVGSFLGDHTKTSVNVLFNTGTTVGPFAQLLASISSSIFPDPLMRNSSFLLLHV